MKSLIDLTILSDSRENNIKRCRERDIIIPTFKQMKNPELVPQKIKDELKNIGLWDINSRNLFRITWKNEPVEFGGGYGDVNFIEFPKELTGVDARIVALVGKWFPTGAHKVGATFGCLVPYLITGHFDSTKQKAVWPSTGNYCRGGAYDANLLACESIAILPEEMSRERFEWLAKVAGEVIATPGCESNVKEIFDKCNELAAERGDKIVIFNQFDQFGNYLWHYELTGSAIEEVFDMIKDENSKLVGYFSSTGSSGTIAAGDYLKQLYPDMKIAAGEALQCPTLLINGFGGHRIEGIGDKHVPFIHNVRNTDMIVDIDDNDTMDLIRLFNEEAGKEYLVKQGIAEDFVNKLDLLGISGVGNLIGAIKFAKYYELDSNDVVFTILTDSMELYQSRLKEMHEKYGKFTETDAARIYYKSLQKLSIDYMKELTYYDKKRIHNLKYYTWVEQQGKSLEELNAQWYDYKNYWASIQSLTPEIDKLIEEFNKDVGLL